MKNIKFLGMQFLYLTEGDRYHLDLVAGPFRIFANNMSRNKWIFTIGSKKFVVRPPTLSDIRYNTCEFFKKLNPMPVYFHYTSSDCDQFEVNDVKRFSSYRAYLAHREQEYQWLEGPIYYSRCSKKYFESYERNTRDHRAEFYNY